MKLKTTLILTFFFMLNGILLAQNNEVSITKTPSWVTTTDFIENIDPEDELKSSGVHNMLADFQDHITNEHQFVRYGFKILNTEGLQSSSDINISFDPSYQELQIHKILIYRDGVKINRLAKEDIQVFRKEENADRYLYDGSLNAAINLEGVRVGDIVEYSYSIIGFNPIHNGRYFAKFYLESSSIYSMLHIRIINSDNRKLFFDYKNDAPKPEERVLGTGIEYSWNLKLNNPLYYEASTPSWYDPYSHFSVSEFSSWSDVVKWALPHYSFSGSELEKVKRETGHLFSGSKEDNILKAIRFVQDEVRYLGFESGMSAYKPNLPSEVLKRRFGDCKDKSVLLAAILSEQGIPSSPMLVNSSETKAISTILPTPHAFDHCVVAINYNGAEVYIDPTINSQGGKLKNYFFPNYEKGLVLSPESVELIELPTYQESYIEIKERFKLGEVGKGAAFEIETHYHGDKADVQRSVFSSNTIESLSESYENYYNSIYPTLERVTDIKIADDKRDGDNIFIVKESYVIEEFWSPLDESGSTIYSEFLPIELSQYLNTSVSSEREMPLYIGEPTRFFQETIIELPEEWTLSAGEESISGPSFNYKSSYKKRSDKVIEVTYEYEILKNMVEVEHVSDFAESQKRIENDLTFNLTYDLRVGRFQLSWISLLLIGCTLIIGVLVIKGLEEGYNPKVDQDYLEYKPKPIGGWLILIAISLIITPIRVFIEFISEPNFFNHSILTALLDSNGTAYNPELVFVIGFEIAFNVLVVLFTIFLSYLLFKRRTSFPKLMAFYLGIHLIFIIIDTFLATLLVPDLYSSQELNEFYIEIFKSFISICIWIPYLFISKRVKETFLMTRNMSGVLQGNQLPKGINRI